MAHDNDFNGDGEAVGTKSVYGGVNAVRRRDEGEKRTTRRLAALDRLDDAASVFVEACKDEGEITDGRRRRRRRLRGTPAAAAADAIPA